MNPKKNINNNVPTPDKATEDRIKSLLWYLRRFGIPETYLFEVEDLKEMANIPRVTRTIAMLGKMVRIYISNSQFDQRGSYTKLLRRI